MGTYELWRMAMYGVGVFVTCNAGGMALRRLFRRAAAPIAAVRVGPVSPDELADALSALKKAAPDKSRADEAPDAAAPDGWTPQSLSDMRRQYESTDAQRRTAPDAAPTALSPALHDALTRWIMSREQAEGKDWPPSARNSLAQEFRDHAEEYGAEAVVALVNAALADGTRKLIPWDWLEREEWRTAPDAATA